MNAGIAAIDYYSSLSNYEPLLMLLYIVRHGDALSELVDPARPLSSRGVKDIKAVASVLEGLKVGSIHHSMKARARETALLLAASVSAPGGVRESDGLRPGDSPSIWAGRLEAEDSDMMLVGHLPHVSGLASALVAGDSRRVGFAFSPGSVLCLLRDDGRWWVRWMLSPGLLARSG